MSKNEKVTEEKVMTKYDRKVQKRKEEAAREKKEKKATVSITVLLLVAAACFVISFPIRSFLALNQTFVTVGGENLTKVEFEYNYNVVMKNYMNAYGSYLSYFGLDTTQDLDAQMYDDTLTWKDYFQEMTVDNLIRSKSIKAEAVKAGFEYDAAKDFAEFEENTKKAAMDAGVSLSEYVKGQYGPMATLKRIEPYVKEALMISAYYEELTEDRLPSEEEIKTYYNENTDDYDSVDYRIVEVLADLPETSDYASTADQETEGPSEEEIATAMKEAKTKAEEAKKTIKTSGELKENVRKSSPVMLVRDWLFDAARKKGDTTILEDNNSHKYYVVAFEKRYLDETPSINARVIMTSEDGQALLDQWKAGEATEESFAAMCDQYSEDTSVEGGLYEELTKTGLNQVLSEWLFANGRKSGDVENLKIDETYDYVVYFVGQDRPEWEIEIEKTLSDDIMTAYVEEISADCQIAASDKNLPYIKKREAQKAAEESEAAESQETQNVEESAE